MKEWLPELKARRREWRNNRNKLLREYLMNIDPTCYWCHIKVIYFTPVDNTPLPDNFATIDHLISRRFRKKGEVVEKVLACNKCNLERARDTNV